MVAQVVSTGSGNGVELVIGQRVAELPSRGCQGVIESEVRIVHLVHSEHSLQTAFVETRIVGNEGDGCYLVA